MRYSARHGGASRRVVEQLAGLHSCACRHRHTAFEGERRWRTTYVGANGPPVPWLLECDVCTTEVLFCTEWKPVDCCNSKLGVISSSRCYSAHCSRIFGNSLECTYIIVTMSSHRYRNNSTLDEAGPNH